MLAESTGKLDLSECNLSSIPKKVFELGDSLEELSLAGNQITSISSDISKLTSLRLLQLSGNYLTSLPEEIGCLTLLEGLWVHGNFLKQLPSTIGQLTQLAQLSLAGNQLTTLPDSIGSLHLLKDLSAAGNQLTTLPHSIGNLQSLEKLTLHGNLLETIPSTVGKLSSLKELSLHGNATLRSLPSDIGMLKSVQHISCADCNLKSIPAEIRHCASLQSLSLYGNRQLIDVPVDMLTAPMLKSVWLEGCEMLSSDYIVELMHGCADVNEKKGKGNRCVVGLDSEQIENIPWEILSSFLIRSGGGSDNSNGSHDSSIKECVKISHIPRSKHSHGYFKLESPHINHTTPTHQQQQQQHGKVLVVAFGSAPGVPNWGGLLNRVRQSAESPPETDFDVLYIVDPYRSWYNGGDDTQFEQYNSRLAAIVKHYNHVVMIGDSMGATAALMFAHHATSVHAFCPQIDLGMSSIRPAESNEWWERLRQRIMHSVHGCDGRITVHVGNWDHDVRQANLMPVELPTVHVKVYSINSHRLALALDKTNKLLPLLRSAILNEMGIWSNSYRVSNLL